MVETQNGKGGRLVAITATAEEHGVVETQNGNGGTLVALSSTVKGSGLVQTENGEGDRLVKITADTDGGTVMVDPPARWRGRPHLRIHPRIHRRCQKWQEAAAQQRDRSRYSLASRRLCFDLSRAALGDVRRLA